MAARIVQAAGAALLVPSSLAIVLEAHQEHERMHAVALWSAVAALAAGIGPPLGGLLITASSWRLVFLVNIPVGIVAFLLAGRVLVESRAPGRRRMPDLLRRRRARAGDRFARARCRQGPGMGLGRRSGGGCVRARRWCSGAYFVVRSSRHRSPVIDLSLLRIRAFALSNGVTVVMASGFYAYTLCNVLFLTSVWRYSILARGPRVDAGAVHGDRRRRPGQPPGGTGRSPRRRRSRRAHLGRRHGLLRHADRRSAPDFLGGWLPGMVILGVGAGLTFPTLSGAAVGSVPGPRFAVATALNSVSRQLGAALGVAVLIAILGNPTPLQALHAFEHGWRFAGSVFPRSERLSAWGSWSSAQNRLRSCSRAAFRAAQTGSTPTTSRRRSPHRASPRREGEHAEVAPQTVAEFLRNVPVFAGLSAEMLQDIAALARDVSIGRGEWLFRQGDRADGVYVVRVGHLEVVHEGEDPVTINTLTRGAVLGELALLSDSLRSASVRGLRDSELLMIDKPHFDALLHSEPELALSLARVLSAQLQASRAVPVARRAHPVTIVLRAVGSGVPLLELADELSRAMCAWGKVAVLHPGEERRQAAVRLQTRRRCDRQVRPASGALRARA